MMRPLSTSLHWDIQQQTVNAPGQCDWNSGPASSLDDYFVPVRYNKLSSGDPEESERKAAQGESILHYILNPIINSHIKILLVDILPGHIVGGKKGPQSC